MKKSLIALLAITACSIAAVKAQNVTWKKNFGGSDRDYYHAVVAVSDGYVAVGESYTGSFGNGNWYGITEKGGTTDAIIVKYDNAGNMVWKKNFGGLGGETFKSVTAVSDGIVAAGWASYNSFGNGDLADILRKGTGSMNAIIVKYDNAGNIVWIKNFNGEGISDFNSVITVPNGIVAAGYSTISIEAEDNTFDWAGYVGNGGMDAIIVKYDNAGNVVWKRHFGGTGHDVYTSVTATPDGLVAAGSYFCYHVYGVYYCSPNSGDWLGNAGKSGNDAVVVKYSNTGNVQWKKNFGGNSESWFNSVATVSDGVVAVGGSYHECFGNGDWKNVTGNPPFYGTNCFLC